MGAWLHTEDSQATRLGLAWPGQRVPTSSSTRVKNARSGKEMVKTVRVARKSLENG